MIRLLTANLTRIKKSKLFWSLCGIVALFAFIMIIYMIADSIKIIDNAITLFVIPIEIAAAIFISIFFGTEYSDGAIRNKLVVGHRRHIIYLANFITSVICSGVFVLSYMLPVVLLGFSCVGLPSTGAIKILAVGLVTLIAFGALFTMVSMIYANKAGATVINLVLAFMLLIVGYVLCSYLMQPELIPTHGIGNELEYIANPRYLSGAKRTFVQMLNDLLPAGQAVRFIYMGDAEPLWSLPLYSIGVGVELTTIGAVVFDKKDIK